MLLRKDDLCHINSITHEGKVLVFGTHTDGKVYYTVRQDGFEENYGKTQVMDWENWQVLNFPNETIPDRSVVDKEQQELIDEDGQPLLRSLYQTQDQTAIAPVQLVSGLGHLYVFRQSKTDTLLVDRFVLDGMTNQLMPKYEVRFKRSKQKYQPLQTPDAQDPTLLDTMDFRDANGNFFYEPTQEISLVKNLHQGWFAVVLVPTREHDRYRWHIFAYNKYTQQVEVTSLRASEEGRFDVKDYTLMEPKPDDDDLLLPRSISGIIRQRIDMGAKVSNGLSATFYYTQSEQQQLTNPGDAQIGDNSTLLLKELAKVMLVMPTERGPAAAINFSVAQDGTLSLIDNDKPISKTLRKTPHDVLLPLDTLDNIKAMGRTDLPQGDIAAIARSETGQQVDFTLDRALEPGTSVKIGSEVKIESTTDYNGYYQVQAIDANTFEVDANQVKGAIGRWEVLPDEETLDFDGIITGFKQMPDGKLRVFCPNHGLDLNDEVQITGTGNYSGIYPVTKSDTQHFTVETKWQPGEVVNLKVQSLKRRGVTFSGRDLITFPTLKLNAPTDRSSFGETLSAWIYPARTKKSPQFILGRNDRSVALILEADEIKFRCTLTPDNIVTVTCPASEKEEWVHYAGIVSLTKETVTLTLCKNGEKVAQTEVPSPPPYKIKATPWSTELAVGATTIWNSSFSGFSGKIAEVQLWQRARSPQEVNDTMHLLLTGKELDLAGYWRLGAIAEGKERRVTDFSVQGNDGVAFGNAYVSAVTLNRALKGGATDATKYSNSELFAVTQRATYEEQFEFRAIPKAPASPLNPNNIDGQGNPMFRLNYWGQRSRSDKKRIEIADANVTMSQFETISKDGWYRASAKFTIPDGVTMLRSFEIDRIKGDWLQLEIRKHQIQLVSNTITEERYGDNKTLKLETLGNDTQSLETLLLELAPLEQREAVLIVELRKLEEKLKLAQSQDLVNKIAALNAQISVFTQELATLKDKHSEELSNPLNYWCRLVCRSRANGAARVYTKTKDLIHGNDSGKTNSGAYSNYQFKFEFAGEDNGQRYYTIVSRYENRILDLRKDGSNTVYGHTEHHKGENQQWRFVRQSDNYYQIYSRWGNRVLDLSQNDDYDVIGYETFHKGSNQQWLLDIVPQANDTRLSLTNDNIANAKAAVDRKQQELAQAKQQLNELEQIRTASVAQQNEWSRRINELKELISKTQQAINLKSSTFLHDIKTPAVQAMKPINTDRLMTTGAFLGFVRPQGRLSAIDSCTGHVQLSYFDDQGRMRQTRYDATSDSRDRSYEQWIPDALRTCLNFSQDNSVLKLQQSGGIGVRDRWTVEAWFVYPLPAKEWNTLVGNNGFQIVVNQGKRLGTRIADSFLDCGYNLEQLAPGWHHLTAVGIAGKASTTTFYLDGERVGDTRTATSDRIATLKKQPSSPAVSQEIAKLEQSLERGNLQGYSDVWTSLITHIGNHPNGGQPFGKLAEVRVWQLALGADEIEINSKTVLNGYEPGLLAYYPMSEGNIATVQKVNDISPQGQHGQAQGAVSWWPCAAPIGNPGHQTIMFDGKDDYVSLGNSEALNFSGAITISAWIRPFSKEGIQNIVAHGYTVAPDAEVSLRIADGYYLVGSWDGQDYGVEVPMQSGDVYNWVYLTGVYDGTNWILYRNGKLLKSAPASKGAIPMAANWAIGATGQGNERFFRGEISEISIWNRALSETEIKANMGQRLSGTEPGLQGYWLLNSLNASPQKVMDLTLKNNPGVVKGKPVDAVICTEYATQSLDPVNGQKTAMMRRFLATIAPSGVSLLSNQRIEQLEMHWVGNAQFKPTLLGYIEGAPPVPSENLTVNFDYNGATSVELTVAEDVTYQWNREQDAGFGATASLFMGIDQEIKAGPVAELQTVLETRQGFMADLAMRGSFLNSSSVSTNSTSTISDKLELRGTPETTPKFEHLGTRFIPKNVGYAVVVSGLADVYVTRLTRSKRMIGYQLQPAEGFEPDVNTITFMMNPAYTMNGSLDGMTGTQATSDRFFRHVPQMRNQYGSLYPASYYRLKEAYALKQEIEQQDADREAYFCNFNSRLLDETSLNQEIGVDAPEEDNKEQRQALKSRIQNSEKLVQATSGLANWQKKMEAIQLKAGKRNIVNTYVWDADGGLRAETQQFASTIEHTIGGSFTLEGAIGGTGGFKVMGAGAELTAQATFHLTQTMTKTESRSRGVALTVDLSGVEKIGITDYNDNPLLPGEKVDRYRFMSFYLERATEHFDRFFDEVVDPEWLQSNDEEARALRQVRSGNPNPAWRVMHRVTYVERPALMGFGQDLRKLTAGTTPTDTKRLLDRLDDLETENEQLSKKLDRILNLLQSQSSSAPAPGELRG
jgi:Concanavalin A-like lectin/glucanases superfamily/Ricin-type beta-trefoil lectin domain-like